jgi:hypothetical protein
MRPITVIAILFICLINNIVAQDSLRNRKIEFEFGGSSMLPLSMREDEILSSGELNQNFKRENIPTLGFHCSFGYNIPLIKSFDFIGNISFKYFSLNKQLYGNMECMSCQIPVQFNGFASEKTNFYLAGISPTIRYKYNKFIAESDISFSYIINQQTKLYSKDIITKVESNSMTNRKNVFYTISTGCKLGYEILPNRLYILGGVNVFYQSKLIKYINSQLSFKLKIY